MYLDYNMLLCCRVSWLFFFFKQKTAYELRISDWSSDVCSSDLGTIPGGIIENGKLHIDKLRADTPEGAEDLVLDLYQQLPPARITDLLLEVDERTGFSEAFTHLRTGAPCSDRIGLMNVLLAGGVNLSLRKMAAATNTHSFWELLRIARWHVEGSAYDRALAMIVEAHAALPMAAFWGQGQSASSDGQ